MSFFPATVEGTVPSHSALEIHPSPPPRDSTKSLLPPSRAPTPDLQSPPPLSSASGAVASLKRGTGSTAGRYFKGGSVCGDNWFPRIPSRYAQPHRRPGRRVWSTHGQIPPKAFSRPPGQRGLWDKAKLDNEAGHGPKTSTRSIHWFIHASMGPEYWWYAGSCADSQGARTPLLSGALTLT